MVRKKSTAAVMEHGWALHDLRTCLVGRVFQYLVFPKYMVALRFIPGCLRLSFLSIGDVLMISPLVALIVIGYFATFVSPSLEGSGWIAWYAIVATFVYAYKKSNIMTLLLGLSWERMVTYHYLAALVAIVLSCFHGYVAYTGEGGSGDSGDSEDRRLDSNDSVYSLAGPDTDLWKYLWDGGINTSGTLLTLCMVGLVGLSALRVFRYYFYELWLVLHVLLSVAVIVFGVMHAIGTMLLLAGWWIVDIGVRYGFEMLGLHPKKAQLSVQDDIVEMRFDRPIRFRAGQYIRVAVPALNVFAFHAATISSAPHEENMTVHLKILGGWTKRLHTLAEKQQEATVLVEGPYGGLSFPVEQYDTVLLVCGGVGITPAMCLARHVLHSSQQHGHKKQKVRVVWAVKDWKLTQTLPILSERDLENPTWTAFEDSSDSGTGLQAEANDSRNDTNSLPTFRADVYVTKKQLPTKEQQTDSILPTNHHFHTGRPNLDEIIATVSDRRVAVVACGPRLLVHATKVACRTHSGCGVQRDFHEEVFEY